MQHFMTGVFRLSQSLRQSLGQTTPKTSPMGRLLTGFDAPVEQVMYIDKKVRDHNLLQTIARVNRIAKGKSRGFIVDYIGLTAKLSITDEWQLG